MSDLLLTLTTDFGTTSPYVAAMKGVLLGINPALRLVDLTHDVPPQDVRHAALFLADSLPYYPIGTLHLIVVDPGVGTDRALLHVAAGGHQLIAPDNGCWTLAVEKLDAIPCVRQLTNTSLRRHPVSSTFHGRDILAPAAGHLSLGLPPAQLGPTADDWVRFRLPEPIHSADRIVGEVLWIDTFGNLLTNLSGDVLMPGSQVFVGGRPIPRVVRTYGEAAAGSLVALVSSGNRVEVARVCGNAAEVLGAKRGTPVEILLHR